MITTEQAQAFFKDIGEVYKKHGITISHEDHQGSFELERENIDDLYNSYNWGWLYDAKYDIPCPKCGQVTRPFYIKNFGNQCYECYSKNT